VYDDVTYVYDVTYVTYVYIEDAGVVVLFAELLTYVYDDVTYVYDDVTYVYDDVTYVYIEDAGVVVLFTELLPYCPRH